MVKVKIINGVYGYKAKGVCGVQIVRCGEVVEVAKSEARRLQDLGVAVPFLDNPQPAAEDTNKEDQPPTAPPTAPPSAADPVA